MIDINFIRHSPEAVANNLNRRNEDPSIVDSILQVDSNVREITTRADNIRARRNSVSRQIGIEKRKPTQSEVANMHALSQELQDLSKQLNTLTNKRRDLLLQMPNMLAEDVPYGIDESCNVVIDQPAKLPTQTSQPHWDLAKRMGLIDLESAAKMSGARFYILKGLGAKLNRALSSWMLDVHTNRFGYQEVEAPVLVRRETMIGSGNLPKFFNNLYNDAETDLWLVPTGEVMLNALHSNTIVKEDDLPFKYVTLSPCFRKEHTAAGRDVRGIKRVRQFQKVELFRFENPSNSTHAQEEMLQQVRSLCDELGLISRVVKLCTGDTGFQSARTFDVEVWAPGSQDWLEVSSISVCSDFQARRTNTRFRSNQSNKPDYLHTLNASGLALPRIWIAVLECGLQEDGSVLLPKPIQPYIGTDKLYPPSE